MRNQLENSIRPSALIRNDTFGHPLVSKTTENVNNFLRTNRRKELTLEQLNELKQLPVTADMALIDIMNPYMLGISQIYSLVHASWRDRNLVIRLEDLNIGQVRIACNVPILLERWKLQTEVHQPLSGVLFVSDQASSITDFHSMVVNSGAARLGIETTETTLENRLKRGGAKLVKEGVVPFALADGNDENAQMIAERHDLYSITLRIDERGQMCTITTKFYQDLKFITEMSGIMELPRMKRLELEEHEQEENQRHREVDQGVVHENPGQYLVFILLGLKDYKTDNILYSLANYLSRNTTVTVCLIFLFDVRSITNAVGQVHFNNQEEWENCMKCHFTDDDCARETEEQRASAIHFKMSSMHVRAKRAVRKETDWTLLISPVLEKCFDPIDEATMSSPTFRHRVLRTPLQVYNNIIHQKNWERVTIPLKEAYRGHSLQITTGKIETPELLRISQLFAEQYIPALNIPPNGEIPTTLYHQL